MQRRLMHTGIVITAALFMGFAVTASAQNSSDEKPIEFTAGAIQKEFKGNADKAIQKYFDKFVHISGVSGGQLGTDVFYIKDSQKGPVIVKAAYYNSPKAEQAKLKAVKPNSPVVIIAKVRSFVSDTVELSEARLVRIGK